MSEENLKIWNAVKQPPTTALKQINGGRLNGKTDINPQWRYMVMTEHFGMCGIGWKYEIAKTWTEPATENQVFCFAEIKLYVKVDGKWSDPIPGLGGHMMIEKEAKGLHANDEGYKMAITDALSVSLKMLGVAADVYAGLWDGARYKEDSKTATKTSSISKSKDSDIEWDKTRRPEQVPGSNEWILSEIKRLGISDDMFLTYLNQTLHIPVEKTVVDTLKTVKITNDVRAKIASKINATAAKVVSNA